MKLKLFPRRAYSAGAVALAACFALGLPTAPVAKAAGPPPRTAAQGGPLPDLTVGVDRLRSSLSITNRSFSANSCSVVEGCISTTGTRRLLTFDLQIQNLGNADAMLGSPSQRPDLYVFSPCHGHYHLLDSLDYAMGYGGTDTPAVYDSVTGTFFLSNKNSGGAADMLFSFGGGVSALPLSGDWDGDGDSTIGVYEPSTGAFFLKNTNAAGAADVVFTFGPSASAMQPIVGDWDGDGKDSVGLYDPTTGACFLKNTNANGPADVVFTFGAGGGGQIAVVGDWDGNDTDTIGLYSTATGAYFLKNSNTSGGADVVFTYGAGGALKPIVGDWNADGVDTVGLYDPSTGGYLLRDSNTPGGADYVFTYGTGGPNSLPVMGDWDYDMTGPTVPGIVGLKQAFCWLDSQRIQGNNPPHYNCSNQGITAGWSDVYGRTLDCQWIDITGLAPGNYQMRTSVNDTHTIVTESDYSNNTVAVKVHITPAGANPTVPKVTVTSPSGPKQARVGQPITITWSIKHGENITDQEVWMLPSPKKKKAHGKVEDDEADARNAQWKLLGEKIPANVRSFTYVPTSEDAIQYPVRFMVRTTDRRNMVGTDTLSTGRIKIVE